MEAIDVVISSIRGTDLFEEDVTMIKSISVRMNISMYSKIHAISIMTNESMNTTLINVLQVGHEEIMKHLSDEEKSKHHNLTVMKLKEIYDEQHAPTTDQKLPDATKARTIKKKQTDKK
ncbi:MAG: hypothetical protein PHF56_02300 [Desulfuromonadaceae bacterium]|nr:hypothetical protein [Desulfuromonadaceae bacterium]